MLLRLAVLNGHFYVAVCRQFSMYESGRISVHGAWIGYISPTCNAQEGTPMEVISEI